MNQKLGLWFFSFFLLLAAPVVSQAATFNVNVLDDPTPMAAPNGCSNASINGGRCSLREAVIQANASSGPHIIQLQDKTYTLTITGGGEAEQGSLDLKQDITIQGAAKETTVIEGGPSFNDRLFVASIGPPQNVTFRNLTLQKGNVTGSGGAVSLTGGDTQGLFEDVIVQNNQATVDGGGIFLSTGSSRPFIIRRSSILNNKALGTVNGGGGIFSGGAGVLLDMEDSLVEGNESSADGGGLWLGGNAPAASFHSVLRSEIRNNKALSGRGGGIFESSQTGMKVVESKLIENTSLGEGGGINASNGGTPTGSSIENTEIRGNKNQGTGAGAFLEGNGTVFIKSCSFVDNDTQGMADGGGAFITNGGGFQVTGSTFSGNKAINGGGLVYTGATTGNVHDITNSTFSGNTASGTGGGIHFPSFGSDPITMNNVTVVGNTSGSTGAGVNSNNGSVVVQLRNSLFAQNDSPGQADDCAGPFASLGFNIFGSPNDGDCKPDGQNVGFNTNDIVGDPLIGSLADNGGGFLTHTLLSGSPAIDGGDPSGCKDGGGANLTVDQRGQTRPGGPRCDIGAVELGISDLVVTKTADASSVNVGDNVTYTITVTNGGPNDNLNVTLTDTLPAGVTLVSTTPAHGTCTPSGSTITCGLGKVSNGANAVVTVVVTTGAEGQITNSATVSGSETDPNSGNNTATVDVTVASQGGGGGGGGGGCALTFGAVSHLNGPVWWLLGLIPILFIRRRGSARG